VGKLRDSLDNARKLISGLQTTTDNFSKRLKTLTKGSAEFMKGGFAAMDELYLYVCEKLKKKNIPFETAKNATLQTLMDSNIKNYLDGVQFIINETAKFNTDFAAIAADKSIDNTLNSLDPLVANIAEQIRKKKKKLLQSKKYKVKITNYEGTLNSLRQIIRDCKEELEGIRDESPPSVQRLRTILFATENTKLVQLKTSLSEDRKKLYAEYNSLILKLNKTAGDIREEKEFAEVMKSVKEMVDNALEMEKEGGND
jgi:hypothetical protein